MSLTPYSSSSVSFGDETKCVLKEAPVCLMALSMVFDRYFERLVFCFVYFLPSLCTYIVSSCVCFSVRVYIFCFDVYSSHLEHPPGVVVKV